MDQGEPVLREHPFDVILELVAFAVHLMLVFLGLDKPLFLTAQSLLTLSLDTSFVRLDATTLQSIMEGFLKTAQGE